VQPTIEDEPKTHHFDALTPTSGRAGNCEVPEVVLSNIQRPNNFVLDDRNFPIVCVGGSAGGLDAYIRLLDHLPPDIGVAIVIVNHLRHVGTMLDEILPHHTAMPVQLITDRLSVLRNHVFIIPAQRDLHISNGEFRLEVISKPRGWPDVITIFLRSLAANWRGQLIVVIVSGYDGDGADALCDIREAGGITIAQRLETAEHPDMPASAIATGCIDFILSPEEIATKIVSLVHAMGTGDDPSGSQRRHQ
jgi:two-component system chemotaxis response regulator CheB